MKQYTQMLKDIQQKGSIKSAARANMPGTTSLFGYQFRHDLADGFPAITTKKLYWKGVVIELLWFLKGDTHIKFLDDHGVRKMWHEDAYNYYMKICSQMTDGPDQEILFEDIPNSKLREFTFEEFCEIIKNNTLEQLKDRYRVGEYMLGDCGMQYGKLWRNWEGVDREVMILKTNNMPPDSIETFRQRWKEASKHQKDVFIHNDNDRFDIKPLYNKTDQIKELIDGLKKSPMGRRHIITAWNPATLQNMALNACHAFVQFNCRQISLEDRIKWVMDGKTKDPIELENLAITQAACDSQQTPQYYLDCQMYQRSADAFLGVPLNIASYALLTHILCKMCNMIPGDMVYTYGDAHIYDNHKEQVAEQLSREEKPLPTLKINDGYVVEWDYIWDKDIDQIVESIISGGWQNIFQLENYDPDPAIKGDLSTGLK